MISFFDHDRPSSSSYVRCKSCARAIDNTADDGDDDANKNEDKLTSRQTRASSVADEDVASLNMLFRCEPQLRFCEKREKKIFYTDVVVVGNGPSALALSAFLSGYRPYYEPSTPHPEPSLHEKLTSNPSKSLLEHDLQWLCEGLEGRTNHQVSLLYDYLVRPAADNGQENASTLRWKREPNDYVPHVVLGKGATGGTWADFAPELLTLSYASWLDLPGYSFRQWLDKEGANFATDLQMKIDATPGGDVVGRVPCAAVRQYFREYVRILGMDKNVFEYALVTSVRKTVQNPLDTENGTNGDDYPWDVFGCYTSGPFHFRCRKVVLATGVTVPRKLRVCGEDDRRVLHSATQLERAIAEYQISTNRKAKMSQESPESKKPFLVVGDGLSAADAVIKCLINNVPVTHVFRKTPKDSKQILSKLSKIVYPDYHTVFQLMTGVATDPLYTVYARTQVQQFEFDPQDECGLAVLRENKSGNLRRVHFNKAIILIGFEADLSFLSLENNDKGERKLCRDENRPIDSKTNTLNADPFTGQCAVDEDLYALGPLIGDNFVRYVVGGSLAAAADIVKRK